MVAASVVTTILVLNYHHRHADTHEMPEWVLILVHQLGSYSSNSGPCHFPTVDPLVPQDVPARGEDNQEDNHDAEEDEGDGAEGDLLQVSAS